MIGALLRLPHEAVMARMLETLAAQDFDVSATELGVFLYPGPERRRPADLARPCNMSRQAMNYVLSGLERRGYLRRQDGLTPASRMVRMTPRGRSVFAALRRCVADIEREWSQVLGTQRFEALRAALHDLSVWLGKLPVSG